MPVKPNFNPNYLYFITAVSHNHLWLFRSSKAKRILLDSLQFMRAHERAKTHAFVLMPNHLHLISSFPGRDTPSSFMRDLKKFTSRWIRMILEQDRATELLFHCRIAGQRAGHECKIWGDGFDAREIFSLAFLQQKLDYIHFNPCQPKWRLAERPEDYPWSSARYYLLDEPAIIPLDDLRDVV